MRRPPVSRLAALFAVMAIALAGVAVRVATLQVAGRDELASLGLAQRIRTIELPAARGEILDRNLTPLAVTVGAVDVYANPGQIDDAAVAAARIAPVLGIKPREMELTLRSEEPFVYVSRQLPEKTARELRDMEIPGIGFIPVPKRFYPAGPIAPQVLGFVDVDNVGIAGLEDEFDVALAGTPGTRTTELSADGLPISTAEDTLVEPTPGVNLVSTIDRQLQFQVQAALADAVEANGAIGGTVVVLDPDTGDVYAMASYPWFDPNDFADVDPMRWRNRAVTDSFEPGSVNKIITAAAAIETGAVGLEDRFRVPASMQVGPFTIHDSHAHPPETMLLGDIIEVSSNIGAAMVAERVGSERLADYMERFGYGEQTGIGFPGEASGEMPAAWDDVIRATASYGQGVAVTPLQMAGVYATIANDGTWVQPRLVRGTVDDEGAIRESPASETRQVLQPATAAILTRMLASAVEEGTGLEAQITGYQVAGKTGTSRKIDVYGNYVQRYMASFVGFLPAGNPEVVIAVSIDEPDTVYGGVAAAPLFQEIARYAIQRLAIPSAAPVPRPPLISDLR